MMKLFHRWNRDGQIVPNMKKMHPTTYVYTYLNDDHHQNITTSLAKSQIHQSAFIETHDSNAIEWIDTDNLSH
jgi:hypothetical protein